MMKRNTIFLLLIALLMFSAVGLVEATPSRQIYAQHVIPKDGGGQRLPRTSFDVAYVFSNNSDCTNVVLNVTVTNTTDDYGEMDVQVNTSAMVTTPSYICRYFNTRFDLAVIAFAGEFEKPITTSDIAQLNSSANILSFGLNTTAQLNNYFLGSTAMASDSSKLGGLVRTYYLNQSGFSAANITSGTFGDSFISSAATWSAKAGSGTCASGMIVQNATSAGVQCVTDQTGSGLGSGFSGWQNSSTTVWLISNTTNVSINNTDLYVDTRNDRVGIGKSNPATALDVLGTITATTFSGAGTSLTGTGSSFTAGTATSALQLNGQSGAYYVNNTLAVCFSNGTNCPASASGAANAGWLNDSNTVRLANNNTNISIGNATGTVPNLFIDERNDRVGIQSGTLPLDTLDVRGGMQFNVSGGNNKGFLIQNETGSRIFFANATTGQLNLTGATMNTSGLFFPNGVNTAVWTNGVVMGSVGGSNVVGGMGTLKLGYSCTFGGACNSIRLIIDATAGNVYIGPNGAVPSAQLFIDGNLSVKNANASLGPLFSDFTDSRVGIGTNFPLVTLQVAGQAMVQQLYGNGTPTIINGSGAGAGAKISFLNSSFNANSVNASDLAFAVNLTTGTNPANASIVFNITWANSWRTTPIVTPVACSQNAQQLASSTTQIYYDIAASNVSRAVFKSSSTNLTASTNFIWCMIAVG